MPNDLVTERLETLLLARLSTSTKPPAAAALARELQRYAPTTVDVTRWRTDVVESLQGLEDREVIDAARRVVRGDELRRRTAATAVTRWQQWSDRILPALALGVRADDAAAHKRLEDRDAWAAAITARAYGLWTKGPPPTVTTVCDALTWRALGLVSAPKRCPPEVRAHFLTSYVAVDPGAPERMLRQLAATLISAPRPDLKAFYLALIRCWLVGHEPRAHADMPHATAHAPPRGPSLIEAVRSAARDACDGVFGDRKVFISRVWDALRATPAWSGLALDDFKARLVSAHRKRELELARADLVAAMDPTLVSASETRTDGATFHFIIREPMQ
jgi:hypothetical protein